jgi:hypothetical protein
VNRLINLRNARRSYPTKKAALSKDKAAFLFRKTLTTYRRLERPVEFPVVGAVGFDAETFWRISFASFR